MQLETRVPGNHCVQNGLHAARQLDGLWLDSKTADLLQQPLAAVKAPSARFVKRTHSFLQQALEHLKHLKVSVDSVSLILDAFFQPEAYSGLQEALEAFNRPRFSAGQQRFLQDLLQQHSTTTTIAQLMVWLQGHPSLADKNGTIDCSSRKAKAPLEGRLVGDVFCTALQVMSQLLLVVCTGQGLPATAPQLDYFEQSGAC